MGKQGQALENGKVPQPKMNIEAKIIEGNVDSKKEKAKESDVELLKRKKASGALVEKREKVGWVISRLDEPVVIQYNGNETRISPRQKFKVGNYEKLGKLPAGVVLKKDKKK